MGKEPDCKNEWAIGFDDEKNPEIMTFSIPFKKWAENKQDGRLLVSGFFDLAKTIAQKNMMIHMQNRIKSGVIKPNNGMVN